MNAALRLWSLLTWDPEPEREPPPPPPLELPHPKPPPELKPPKPPPPPLLCLELETPAPKPMVEPVSVTGKGLGVGLVLTKASAAGPRRNRSAPRKGRPGFILCCWLEQLASARSPGPSYSAPWGLPQGQPVGKEEATRKHVTALGGSGYPGT